MFDYSCTPQLKIGHQMFWLLDDLQVTSILLFRRTFHLSLINEPVSETFLRDWFWLLIWDEMNAVYSSNANMFASSLNTHMLLLCLFSSDDQTEDGWGRC